MADKERKGRYLPDFPKTTNKCPNGGAHPKRIWGESISRRKKTW